MDDTTYQFDDDVDARLEEPSQTDKEVVQVVDDAHVTISTVPKKTEVSVTSSSRSSDLASKFLNFLDIPYADAEIVSPLDIHVHHEVLRTQAPTLLTVLVSIITQSSPVYTNITQSSQTFTPSPILTTPTPPLTNETTNPLSTLPDFASVFLFNDRIIALEKSLTARIKEHVKDQLPQILPKEVSDFAPPVIEMLIKELLNEVTLANVSSQPQSNYKAASTLTEFELKKILIDKMGKSESYLAAPEHRDCYYSLIDKDFFSYDVYSLKRGQKDEDKDKDEDPSAGSDRGLKKRKTSKDAEPTTGLKNKDSTSSSSKGTKSQLKPSGKSIQSEEIVFEVVDPDMPQDQEGNLGKTTQKAPTQKWLMTLAASTSTDKSLKDFDELMSTPIDFSSYILNGLKIENLTQEILLGPAFRLLKGTRSNYVELEYEFEECYKALSEKLDWENPEGGDYPFDLSKPLPLITCRNRQRVPVEYFINNDLKYLQGRVSTMTYTTSTTKTKAAQYDLPVTHVKVMRKHGYGYLEEIVARRDDYILYKFKEGDDVADFAIALRMFTRSLVIKRRVEDFNLELKVIKNRSTNWLMRSDELYKFSDGTLTRLLTSLEDITKNIDMEYLPKRRWSTLEKKRAH
ncbi:hypothetical protein Tco_0191308 [Tanacetum coccineum]